MATHFLLQQKYSFGLKSKQNTRERKLIQPNGDNNQEDVV